ncbi:MAG TPA: hypothetical protein VGQ62_07160 [Chloroflexota bacterium]|nr:hypothetical protein [Chloroflexota bacterium]
MAETPPSGPGNGLADNAQQALGHVAEQAQHTASQVTEQAKQQATSQLEQQKGRAVDSLVTVTQALRQTGQHLHEQEQGTIAGYVEQAAERVESVTNHLRSRDIPELLDETQDFARRRPALFVGAAVALGFVGARFLMASGQRTAQRRQSTSIQVAPYGQVGTTDAASVGFGRPPADGFDPATGSARAWTGVTPGVSEL